MVIFCLDVFDLLLTFRTPSRTEYRDSPLRDYVLSSFLKYEVQPDELLPHLYLHPTAFDGGNRRRDTSTMPVDDTNEEKQSLILRRHSAGADDNQLDTWQIPSALITWKSMRAIMPVEWWVVY